MANTDAPSGFNPNIHLAGGTPARISGYNIAPDYATALFSGTVVRSVGNGREIEAAPDGGADTRVLGIFAGCQYVNDTGDVIWLNYWPGIALADLNKVVEAWVYDDPALEFIAQISTVAEADIGAVFEIDQTTTPGNVITGRSEGFIDAAATTNPKVRVTGLAPKIDGITPSEYGPFAKVRCTFLSHERATPGLAAAI